MILRLLADANLNASIRAGLLRRNPEIDFKRAEDIPLVGIQDPEVLAIAARERRVLVSHDVNTLPDHLRDFVRTATSPGIVLVPDKMPIGAAIENILVICEAADASDLQNKVCLAASLIIYGFS
jgi:predicted nuclease of predicted toxin-antitoxin system